MKMENIDSRITINTGDLFDDYFIDPRALYLHCFNALPNNFFIGQIDGEKAFGAFKERFGGKIIREYQYRWYDAKKKRQRFGDTLLLLNNHCLVKFDSGECDIWHDGKLAGFIAELTGMMDPYKEKMRRDPLEVNLVVQSRNKLELKGMEIKRTRLDLELFYGEEFNVIDELIRKRLKKNEDKGIVLLHGLPGTGKTTYLRYLIGKIKKRVLFLSPSVANNLMNPDFIELLIGNPNTVLIIEDADNIIMDRRNSPGSSVSNLLNISDGLLADFLNVQLICTFNNSLTMIDNALLRKGRLIAKHEFGKLSIAQSQRLSDHLGFDTTITRPMTVAEIANPHERQQDSGRPEAIGFRRQTIEN
jgi:ATPase family associated with various cellular activities (AAA)